MVFKLPFISSKPRNPYGPPRPDYKKLVLFGALGFVGVVIVLILSATVFADHSKDDLMTVIGRLQFISNTVTNSQTRIRNDALAKLNSDTSLLLESDLAALQAQLKIKFGQNTIDDNVRIRETDTSVAQQLSNGELLDKFDVTYRDIITQKMNLLIFTMPTVRNSIGGSSYKAAMNKTIGDLKTTLSELGHLSLQ